MKRRLRVMVDLTEVRPGGETGGAKYFVFEFLRRLGASPDTEFTFAYLTNSAVHDEVMRTLVRLGDEAVCVRTMPGFPLPATSPFPPRDRVWCPPPPDLGFALGADVVYCPFGSVELATPGMSCVAFIADVLHRDYPQTLSADGIRHRELVFAQTMRRAQFFQCNSHFVVERLACHYGIPAPRTFHTYNVIHDRLDHTPAAPPPARCPEGPFFYYPANAWVHKNHEGLLLGYRAYRSRRGAAAWPLVLTGHDDERLATIRRWSSGLGLDRSVYFLGHVTERELCALWRRAGALIFPSLHEGFGIPLVEAMHFGVPIAAGNRGSVPEIAGDTALYFDPYRPEEITNALARLESEPDLRRTLAATSASRLDLLCADAGVAKLGQHLLAAASAWPESACTGAHVDGWISDRLVLGLPPAAAKGGTVHIDYIDHSPNARFNVQVGLRPLGTFAPGEQPGKRLSFPIGAGARHATVRVLGGENMNPADDRIHGLCVREVSFVPAGGTESSILWPLPH